MNYLKIILIFITLMSWKKTDLLAFSPDSIVVAKDGSGDYSTIQSAIYAAPNNSLNRIIIHIKSGVYNEKVKIPIQKINISLVGESSEKTIITHDDYTGKKRDVPDINGNPNFRTFTSYTLRVEASDFTAENLTIINTAGEVGQAVALHVAADKAAFKNCKILGHQDTLYISKSGARSYFIDCYITGTTDFIFGAGTALIENCEIVSIKNSYITAASTPQNEKYGFIFKRCQLKPMNNFVDKVWLGRPWRPYAKTVFIDCFMDGHIAPQGWDNWRNESNEKTAFYAELNNYGPGGFPSQKRVTWSHQLKEKDREFYSDALILRGWKPNFVDGKH